MSEKIKKLYRNEKKAVIWWVCQWLWEYFNIDPILVRAVFVVFWIMWWFALLLYIVLRIVIPSKKR